jgi:hypothetical protein
MNRIIENDIDFVQSLDTGIDDETARTVSAYMRRSREKYISNYWNVSGKEYYRNKRGRCEDAPCCGCCNA